MGVAVNVLTVNIIHNGSYNRKVNFPASKVSCNIVLYNMYILMHT